MEKQIEVVATNPGNQVDIVRYQPKFKAFCSIGKKPFRGKMLIEFTPQFRLLEFSSFEKWLKTIQREPMTIEDLACLVFKRLYDLLPSTGATFSEDKKKFVLRVVVYAKTTVHAPVEVEVQSDGYRAAHGFLGEVVEHTVNSVENNVSIDERSIEKIVRAIGASGRVA